MSQPEHLIEGPADAPVRIFFYEDLACKDCAYFARLTDEKIIPAYGNFVAIEHRDFPLTKHVWARDAAIAARHFQKAGLGVKFRRETLKSIGEIFPETFERWVRKFADRNGQDAGAALEALKDSDLGAAVDADRAEGESRGVAKTPTVYVYHHVFIEKVPWNELNSAILEALR